MGDVATLTAVALGGAISAGTAFLLDIRRDRAERLAAAERDARELKIAARFVSSELLDAQEFIEGTQIGEPLRREELHFEAWREHGPTLARLLDAGTWNQVTVAYGRIVETEKAQERGELAGEMTEFTLSQLDDHVAEIAEAWRMLTPLGAQGRRVGGRAASRYCVRPEDGVRTFLLPPASRRLAQSVSGRAATYRLRLSPLSYNPPPCPARDFRSRCRRASSSARARLGACAGRA